MQIRRVPLIRQEQTHSGKGVIMDGSQDAPSKDDLPESRAGCAALPDSLFPLAPITVIVGHYGVGKTNLSLNLVRDAKQSGQHPTLADLDIVNPYFRSSDHAKMLEEAGIRTIDPVFARSNLDVPSLPPALYGAIEHADECACLVIDVGGDDAGATALGRFASDIERKPYDMYYVVNAYRNLTSTAEEAFMLAREIEERCGLKINGVIDNSNMQDETTYEGLSEKSGFAASVAEKLGIPLIATTLPSYLLIVPKSSVSFLSARSENTYVVQRYIRAPWE